MARIDALITAAAAYTADQWNEYDWRQFGRDTGTSDILDSHPRLYRALSFGDPDTFEAAVDVLGQVLDEAIEEDSGENGRMEILADSMADLPTWVASRAAVRTKRFFNEYIAARDSTEIPLQWIPIPDRSQTKRVTEPAEAESWPWDTVSAEAVTAEKEAIAPQPATPTTLSPAVVPAVAVPASLPNIFIVHGHDEAARDSIRIYVHGLTGVVPISLAEQPGNGDTIIEKFERHGEAADFVIVLLTPDDVGQTVAAQEAKLVPNSRARQNVVLELGYFIGKIGREKIVVVDSKVERPSDLHGLSYVEYPGTNWKDALRVELANAHLTR